MKSFDTTPSIYDESQERIATIDLYRKLPGLTPYGLSLRLNIPENRVRKYIGYPLLPKRATTLEPITKERPTVVTRDRCPYCDSKQFVKFGKQKRKQRLLCKRCRRSFLEKREVSTLTTVLAP